MAQSGKLVKPKRKAASRSPLDARAKRWWEVDKPDAWSAVFATMRGINDRQTTTRKEIARFRGLYENKGGDIPIHADTNRMPLFWKGGRLMLNVIRSCVNTASAKIAKSKPRPMFLTTEGEFDLQQLGEQLTQYMDGAFEQANMYPEAVRVFTDSASCGTGALRIFIDGDKPREDPDTGKLDDDMRCIRVERALIDDLFIDDTDAVYGKPRQLHHRRFVSRDLMLARYGQDEDAFNAILAAPRAESNVGSYTEADGDMIEVLESWHLRSGRYADDGRYALCINAIGGALILEPYEKDYFPFQFLRWQEPSVGFWGTGLAEELLGIQLEINRLLRDIHLAQRNATPTIFVEEGSKVNLEHLDNDPRGRIVKYSGTQPAFTSPTAISGEMYSHLERLYQKAYEITGISQLSATAKKPAGLDSEPALNTYHDIETERFILAGQRYEDFFMACARIFIDLSRDLAAENDDLGVKAKSDKRFIKSIKWKDVDIEDSHYVMSIFPTSDLPHSPSGRLQRIKTLMETLDENGRPLLSGAQAARLMRIPDIDDEEDLRTASVQVIRKQVDSMLHGGPAVSPEPFFDLAKVQEIGQLAICRAIVHNAPDENIDKVRAYVDKAIDMQAVAAAQIQAQQAAAAMPPPGAPAPGGPPPMPGPGDMGAPPMPAAA